MTNQPVCPCCGHAVDPVDVLMDVGRGLIAHNGGVIRVSDYQFRMLRSLIEAYPAVVSKDRLYFHVYGEKIDGGPDPKIIDVQVCKLRRMLDPVGLVITTSWGVGYAIEMTEAAKAGATRLKAMEDSRCRRKNPDTADVKIIAKLRAANMPLTEIAAKLRLTYRAVTTAIDQIEETRQRALKTLKEQA